MRGGKRVRLEPQPAPEIGHKTRARLSERRRVSIALGFGGWRFNHQPITTRVFILLCAEPNRKRKPLPAINNRERLHHSNSSTNSNAHSNSNSNSAPHTPTPTPATDRNRLVFEAASNQSVTLRCNLLANPSKSVHFSWFVSYNEHNLTDWLQREAALDEQLDESG